MPERNLQPEDFTGERNEAKLEGLMSAFAIELCKKFNEYAGKRYEKEEEWRRAIEQLNGEIDEADRDKIRAALGETKFNRAVTVNITRPKTNVAIARLQDTQFPIGGDYNFVMRPRPVSRAMAEALETEEAPPEMQVMAVEQGMQPQQAPSPKELATEILLDQIDRGRRMTKQIRKDLVEADYGTNARRSIEDLASLGTAVVKGVYAKYKDCTGYEEDEETGDFFPVVNSEIKAGVSRVDPLYFFPDPSAREPCEIEDSFEVHLLSRSKLIEMSKSKAFMSENIKKVLEMDGNEEDIPPIVQTTSFHTLGIQPGSRFVAHEYHGNLPKELLYEAGVITEEEKDASDEEFYGQAWFIDRHLIRLSLPLIEGTPRKLYHLTTYERDPNSVFGHGVPYLLRHSQRIINNTYLMLMDNAALSSGPQIVLNKEMIEPASRNNDYTLRPNKVWHLTEYGTDVREAMQFVNVPAQQDPLTQIVDMAMRFADIESSIPMMQQGEPTAANNTSFGGLAVVTSALSVIHKRASMRWDDNITRPLIENFYHFNMQYNEDTDIKANLDVEIGGATERIDNQLRGQDIERILGLAQSNPEWLDQVDPVKAFRELVTNSHAGDILRPVKEATQMVEERRQREAQQQQSDPEGLKAQAAMLTAQTNQQVAQANIQAKQQERQDSMAIKSAELQMRQREVEARNMGNAAQMQMEREKFELELAKLADARNMSIAQLQTQLQIKAMDERAVRAKIEGDLMLQQREIEVKNQFGEGL
jgi:hypothetical protein